MQQQQLRSFLDLKADNEIHTFMSGSRSKTAQMKYDQFIKTTLPKFREMIHNYLQKEVEPKFKAATKISEIEGMKIPALPAHIKEEIVTVIDKQKLLNIVEKVYLCLDLLRAVSGEIRKIVGRMAMHYGNALRMAPKIVGADGKSL